MQGLEPKLQSLFRWGGLLQPCRIAPADAIAAVKTNVAFKP
jgi:hypothetical protein